MNIFLPVITILFLLALTLILGIVMFEMKKAIVYANAQISMLKQEIKMLQSETTYWKNEVNLIYKQYGKLDERLNIRNKDILTNNKIPVLEGKRALLGDSTPLREYTESILCQLGFQVDVVDTGFQIMERLKWDGFHYDIIFTSEVYYYPNDKKGAWGLDALHFIKKELKLNIPVILVTSMSHSKNDIAILGYDGYLEKPVSLSEASGLLTNLFTI